MLKLLRGAATPWFLAGLVLVLLASMLAISGQPATVEAQDACQGPQVCVGNR